MGSAVFQSIHWLRFSLVWLTLGLSAVLGCGHSFPNSGLNQRYDTARLGTLGTYVAPSEIDSFDQLYHNLLDLDLISRGYEVINLNDAFENGEAIDPEIGSQTELTNAIRSSGLSGKVDVGAIANLKWEDVVLFWKQNEDIVYDMLLSLHQELGMFDLARQETVLTVSIHDTARIQRNTQTLMDSEEPPHHFVERQISRALGNFPLSQHDQQSAPKVRMQVLFLVDRSYRGAFPNNWEDKLRRRLLYVNDLSIGQLGIEFILRGFREWDSEFESSLEGELAELLVIADKEPGTIVIGVTFDRNLAQYWSLPSQVGLAAFLSNATIVSGQTSTHGRGSWNSIEESLILAHELGHVLGAPHAESGRSIMFPDVSPMSYEFDGFSGSLMKAMAPVFFAGPPTERIANHFRSTTNVYASEPTPAVSVLEILLSDIQMLSVMTGEADPESVFVDILGPEAFTTGWLREGFLGFLHFYKGNWDSARKHLSNSVSQNEDFGEGYEFLGRTLEFLGDVEAGVVNKRTAIHKGRLHVVDRAFENSGPETPPSFIAPTKQPRMLRKAFPGYPSKGKWTQGNVWLNVWVGKDGKPRGVYVERSDSEILNDVSVEAAWSSEYMPGENAQGAVDSWLRVVFSH